MKKEWYTACLLLVGFCLSSCSENKPEPAPDLPAFEIIEPEEGKDLVLLQKQNAEIVAEISRLGFEVREVNRGVLVNLPDVAFEFGSDEITSDAKINIASMAEVLRSAEGRRVSVEGHTDSVGTINYNQDLSERRARAVTSLLVEKGISRRRIVTIGYGESEPVSTNSTEIGRQRNRRVEIIIENPSMSE